jgi:hypothetical protein
MDALVSSQGSPVRLSHPGNYLSILSFHDAHKSFFFRKSRFFGSLKGWNREDRSVRLQAWREAGAAWVRTSGHLIGIDREE